MINDKKISEILINVKTFDQLYKETDKLNCNEKGYLFERITYFMFKLSPLLNNYDELWMYDDIPKKIKTLLKLPPKDKGIDLLMKKNNEYVPIQCKFRQNYNTILNWTELSTFYGLSFGMTSHMKNGYLVTNTYDLCDEVINSEKVKPIYGNFFDILPENFFTNMCNIINNKPIIKYKKKIPYSYQNDCINYVYEYFKNNKIINIKDEEDDEDEEDDGDEDEYDTYEEDSDEEDDDKGKDDKEDKKNNNGFIEMACGTGKSITSYFIDKKLDNKTTIVLVPSLQLLSQFYSDWINQSYTEDIKIKYILVGSDNDVEDEVKYKSNGIILTTDTNKIKEELKSKNKIVLISTYQSADKIPKYDFDFGIFDEAHKTVGQLNKKFALLLKDNDVIIKKRLFMTATPKISLINDDDIISMKDEYIYGKQIYKYNTGKAINDKKLVDYQIISIYAENNKIKQDIMKNKLISFKKEFNDEEANYLGSIIILLKKIHEGTCHHMLTYHSNVKRVKKFVEYLEKVNKLLYKDKNVFIDSLDGKTSMSNRKKILNEFIESDKGILCSARVLNEGVNIPIVDSICFVDNRFSTIDIVQCIGRALRLYNGKQIAKIIIPTFVDDINNIDDCVYGNIIRILKSLRTTDEGITEYFTVKDINEKKNGRKLLITEKYIKNEKKCLEIDLIEWNNKILDKIWNYIDPFYIMFNKIKEWVKKNNKLPSHTSKDNKQHKYGNWCNHRRMDFKKNKLSEDKKKLCMTIKHWYWNQDDLFDEQLNNVKEWIKKNNCMPKVKSKNEEEKKLAKWCIYRRREKKEKELSLNKKNKLEEINNWYWEKEDFFDIKLNNVKEWIIKNKKYPSYSSADEDEKQLARWCTTQRIENKKNKLTNDKIHKIETIPNWKWNENFTKEVNIFDDQFNKLKEWIKNNKRLPSKRSKNEEEAKLGSWCMNKKTSKKNNKLDDEKIKLFETIPSWSWGENITITIKTFEEQYKNVKEWIVQNNKIPSDKSKNTEEKEYGTWCSSKRKNKKKNTLSEDKIKLLEQIPNWYWSK